MDNEERVRTMVLTPQDVERILAIDVRLDDTRPNLAPQPSVEAMKTLREELKKKYPIKDDKFLQLAEKIADSLAGPHLMLFEYSKLKTEEEKTGYLNAVMEGTKEGVSKGFSFINWLNPFSDSEALAKLREKFEAAKAEFNGVSGFNPSNIFISGEDALRHAYRTVYLREQAEHKYDEKHKEKPAAPVIMQAGITSGFDSVFKYFNGLWIGTWISTLVSSLSALTDGWQAFQNEWGKQYADAKKTYLAQHEEKKLPEPADHIQRAKAVMADVRKGLETASLERGEAELSPALARKLSGINEKGGIAGPAWALLDSSPEGQTLNAAWVERGKQENPGFWQKAGMDDADMMDWGTLGLGAAGLALIGKPVVKLAALPVTIPLKTASTLFSGVKGRGMFLSRVTGVGTVVSVGLGYYAYNHVYQPKLQALRDQKNITPEEYNKLTEAAMIYAAMPLEGAVNLYDPMLLKNEKTAQLFRTHVMEDTGEVSKELKKVWSIFEDIGKQDVARQKEIMVAYEQLVNDVLQKNPKATAEDIQNAAWDKWGYHGLWNQTYAERYPLEPKGFWAWEERMDERHFEAVRRKSLGLNGVRQAVDLFISHKGAPSENPHQQNQFIQLLFSQYEEEGFAAFLKNKHKAVEQSDPKLAGYISNYIFQNSHNRRYNNKVAINTNFGRYGANTQSAKYFEALYSEFRQNCHKEFAAFVATKSPALEAYKETAFSINTKELDNIKQQKIIDAKGEGSVSAGDQIVANNKELEGLRAKLNEIQEKFGIPGAVIQDIEHRQFTRANALLSIAEQGAVYQELLRVSIENGQSFKDFSRDLSAVMKELSSPMQNNLRNGRYVATFGDKLFGTGVPGATQLAAFPFVSHPTGAKAQEAQKNQRLQDALFEQFEKYRDTSSQFLASHIELLLYRPGATPSIAPGIQQVAHQTVTLAPVAEVVEHLSLYQIHLALEQVQRSGKPVYRNEKLAQYLESKNDGSLQRVRGLIEAYARDLIAQKVRNSGGTLTFKDFGILDDNAGMAPIPFTHPKVAELLSESGNFKGDNTGIREAIENYLNRYSGEKAGELQQAYLKDYYEPLAKMYAASNGVIKPYARNSETSMSTELAIRNMFATASVSDTALSRMTPEYRQLVDLAKKAANELKAAYPEGKPVGDTLTTEQAAWFKNSFEPYRAQFEIYAKGQVAGQKAPEREQPVNSEQRDVRLLQGIGTIMDEHARQSKLGPRMSIAPYVSGSDVASAAILNNLRDQLQLKEVAQTVVKAGVVGRQSVPPSRMAGVVSVTDQKFDWRSIEGSGNKLAPSQSPSGPVGGQALSNASEEIRTAARGNAQAAMQ